MPAWDVIEDLDYRTCLMNHRSDEAPGWVKRWGMGRRSIIQVQRGVKNVLAVTVGRTRGLFITSEMLYH